MKADVENVDKVWPLDVEDYCKDTRDCKIRSTNLSVKVTIHQFESLACHL